MRTRPGCHGSAHTVMHRSLRIRTIAWFAAPVLVSGCEVLTVLSEPDLPPISVVLRIDSASSAQPLTEERFTRVPPTLLWQGEPLVHPRGIMLDPDGNALWVSDPGEPERDPVNKPARIVRFPLSNGVIGQPEVFFVRPGFLFGAKWAVPARVGGTKQIIVADQGEATSEYTFTGRGAKVLTIPVLADGSAGTPTVLWEGPPFFCPTGVVLIGEFLYVTDPCAGPTRTRAGVSFPSSAIFAVPVTGGLPRLLASGEPFTSLIGICPLVPGEIIVNDTDSGRLDPTATGGRNGFAPPAGAERWILKITDPTTPTLGPPVRTTFTEETPVRLEFKSSDPEYRLGIEAPQALITITTNGGTLIVLPAGGTTDRLEVEAGALIDGTQLPLVLASSVNGEELSVRATVTAQTASSVRAASSATRELQARGRVSVLQDGGCECPLHDQGGSGSSTDATAWDCDCSKDPDRPPRFSDNKHGGARRRADLALESTQSSGSGWVYDRFTLDNAAGKGAVYIYPDGGGTPVSLWSGAPLVRPLAGQLNEAGTLMWITDQATGSLYSLPFPSPQVFDDLFGVQSPQR